MCMHLCLYCVCEWIMFMGHFFKFHTHTYCIVFVKALCANLFASHCIQRSAGLLYAVLLVRMYKGALVLVCCMSECVHSMRLCVL